MKAATTVTIFGLAVMPFPSSIGFTPATFLKRGSTKRSTTATSLYGQRSPPLLAIIGQKHNDVEFLKASDDHKPSPTISSLLFPLALAWSISLASPVMALEPSTFNNDYADPLHPKCRRHIEVSADGKTFQFTGTSVNQPKDDTVLRGCSKAEIQKFGLKKGSFDGINYDDNKISAGDGIHEGIWEPAGTATTNIGYEDVDGIRWKDGNKWVVLQKSVATQVGEFITFSYIGFSLLAGVYGLNNMYQKKAKGN